MSSAKASAIRQKLINQSFGLDETLLSTESHDEASHPNDAIPETEPQDDNTILAVSDELENISERFDLLQSAPLNFHDLVFNPNFELSEIRDISKVLSPTSPSTHRLLYRIHGIQDLFHELQSAQEDFPPLATVPHHPVIEKITALKGAIHNELQDVLDAVRTARELQSSAQIAANTEGLKRYHFKSPFARDRVLPPLVTATIVFISILHSFMHLARERCHFVLKYLRALLQLAFEVQNLRERSYLASSVKDIPITLQTSFQYLGLGAVLDIYVTCSECSTLYRQGSGSPETCSARDLAGLVCGNPLYTTKHRGTRSWKQPIRRYSHQTLEVWLSKFLNRPGIEDLLESAHPTPSPQLMSDFWEADLLNKFPGPGEQSFFDAPDNELRLVFMIYHDFFNPYGNTLAGKKKSIGMVMMVCLNLPPEIRYDRENVYLASVIPGPFEPEKERINNFVRPIAANLKEHFDPGVWISRTHKCPAGRKVRSAAPITSMDIPASRAWGGLGSHSHTIFCSFCNITLLDIDNFDITAFPRRSMEQHIHHVQLWLAAQDDQQRAAVWSQHAARFSEWLQFPWWNVFTGTTVAPMHWTKNILEKHLRENMSWTWLLPAGIPLAPTKSKAVSVLELKWGQLAMEFSNADDFKLTEPLLRYLCEERGLFQAGLPSARMIRDLNEWRTRHGILDALGRAIQPTDAMGPSKKANAVSVARAEYYLSKATSTSMILNNSCRDDLVSLCNKFNLAVHLNSTKPELAQQLLDHYQSVKTKTVENVKQSKTKVSLLGLEVLTEVKQDMKCSSIPSWMKAPPKNFATLSHGKIGAEEYKSLSLVSFTITLTRLWGCVGVGPLRERLDHFLHLVLAVRVLAYQSITESDILMFEHHYAAYLGDLKRLYPHSSITPVQHLGTHIPYFLRNLGPATRFNENPAEMFIGMLQDIPMNWKIEELGVTLHREFVMASDLQGLIQESSFSELLGPVRPILCEFFGSRYSDSPGMLLPGDWSVSQTGNPFPLNDSVFATYHDWATSHGIKPFARYQILCSKLQLGHVIYQPRSHSMGNSQILFRDPSSQVFLPGCIESILQEPSHAVHPGEVPRITVLVRQYQPLSVQDRFYDPYYQHPLIGETGYNIAELRYREFAAAAYLLEPQDIICHIATCDHPDSSGQLSAPAIVILSLDLVGHRPTRSVFGD